MEKKKYYVVRNKRLAEALAYLSYSYYKFNDNTGNITYSFEDSNALREDVYMLKNLRAKRNPFNY